ncbi:hypothetical protein AB1Y20_016864 [Prymnesium parvum]|uniref:CobW C-terminal domain-containing protein n=1 Tax=Prymnesium parvum TaxID=97485 RepID=A0AB34ID45_PRYPA
MEAVTPVSIITGFLGAGKTTLLRHILSDPRGLKIAVIQNELSATSGLERSTMVGPNGEEFEEFVELANGCVCCSVRDDFTTAVERLMEVKGRFDYILIETTGMADPGPVAENFWLDDELESPLRLDGIIAVVDAHNLHLQLAELEACRQVACADVIVLNKVDGVSSEHLMELRASIARLNAIAPVLPTTHSRVPLEKIMHLKAFETRHTGVSCLPSRPSLAGASDGSKAELVGSEVWCVHKAELPNGSVCECCCPQFPPTPLHPRVSRMKDSDNRVRSDPNVPENPAGIEFGTRWLHKDSTFGAVTLVETGQLSLDRLNRFLARFLWEPETAAHEGHPPPEVFRCKGVLHVAGSERMYVLQAVRSTYDLAPSTEWSEEAELRKNRMVFIGRNLDKEVLRTALCECAVPSTA